MIHDVCMQNLPVVFLLDRSGIGGEDGKTHHGLFDLAETLPVPGMTVLAPADAVELREMLLWTGTHDGPCAIRYSKGGKPIPECHADGIPFSPGKWKQIQEGTDIQILAVGNMIQQAIAVREQLKDHGVSAAVIQCSSLKPADISFLSSARSSVPYFTLEEHMETGGFGAYISGICIEKGFCLPSDCIGVPDRFVMHGAHECLLKDTGLDSHSITGRILRRIGREAD